MLNRSSASNVNHNFSFFNKLFPTLKLYPTRYETSSDLRIFENEEKDKKEKELQKKASSLFNSSRKEKRSSDADKKERAGSVSSSAKRINYLNELLKKNSLMNQNQPKSFGQNLIDERIDKDLKASFYLNKKLPTIDFILNQIQYLNQVPLLLICKSVLIINDEYFTDLIKISWNLLLNSDQEISSSAGKIFN